MIKMNKMWIEQKDNQTHIYKLICPICKFQYSPRAEREGYISATEIYKFCPKCGERLSDPSYLKRW